jgi:hypothetical protein
MQRTSQTNQTQTNAGQMPWLDEVQHGKGILLLPTTWVLLSLVQCSSQRMQRKDGGLWRGGQSKQLAEAVKKKPSQVSPKLEITNRHRVPGDLSGAALVQA